MTNHHEAARNSLKPNTQSNIPRLCLSQSKTIPPKSSSVLSSAGLFSTVTGTGAEYLIVCSASTSFLRPRDGWSSSGGSNSTSAAFLLGISLLPTYSEKYVSRSVYLVFRELQREANLKRH